MRFRALCAGVIAASIGMASTPVEAREGTTPLVARTVLVCGERGAGASSLNNIDQRLQIHAGEHVGFEWGYGMTSACTLRIAPLRNGPTGTYFHVRLIRKLDGRRPSVQTWAVANGRGFLYQWADRLPSDSRIEYFGG